MASDQLAGLLGTFSDFKLIKGRKVAQLVIEVPLEKADEALATLGGLPKPDSERWVAVARMNPEAVTPTLASENHGERPSSAASGARPPIEKQAPASGTKRERTLPEKVGMRCNDPAFREWLYRNHGIRGDEDVAQYVRVACNVESRRQILPGSAPALLWDVLETRFLEDTGQMAEERR